jgi:predicted RNase H-like nuclease (RuvC/YqgF family)
MNKEHHLEELRMKVEHMKKEQPQNWIGKLAKSVKVRNIEKKIQELEKSLRNKHD